MTVLVRGLHLRNHLEAKTPFLQERSEQFSIHPWERPRPHVRYYTRPTLPIQHIPSFLNEKVVNCYC